MGLFLAGLLGCSGVPPTADTRWYIDNVETILAQNPWPADGQPMRVLNLKSDAYCSIHLVQVRDQVKPHYHETHEEIVYVIEGTGLFKIDGVVREIKAGQVLMIPPRSIHSFVNKRNSPTTVLSVFTPPFDGKDRTLVDTPFSADR